MTHITPGEWRSSTKKFWIIWAVSVFFGLIADSADADSVSALSSFFAILSFATGIWAVVLMVKLSRRIKKTWVSAVLKGLFPVPFGFYLNYRLARRADKGVKLLWWEKAVLIAATVAFVFFIVATLSILTLAAIGVLAFP